MQLLKKPLLGGAAMLLFGALILFGLTFGLLQVFGSPGPIKRALEESNFYQSVALDALKQAKEEQGEAAIGSLPIDRPEIQNLVKSAASPQLLQAQIENALDAAYAWARSETKELTFSVEIGEIKNNLAHSVEQYAVQYASSLPTCEPGAAIDAANPLHATCLPQGVDPAQFAAQAKNNVLNAETLQDTTLSPDTIKIGNKTLAEHLKNTPNLYRNITWSVYGFGLLALLLAGATILLSATWRAGVRKVSIVFIVVGVLGIAASQLSAVGMNKISDMAKSPLAISAANASDILLANLRGWWLWYSIVLILIGIVGLASLYFTKPATPDADEGGEKEDSAADPQPTSTTPPFTTTFAGPQQPTNKPKSKPPKRLIQ